MSYTITTYNQSRTLATVADGTINTTYDVKLIGKSYAGYGLAQNENFVYLTENFANNISPKNPLNGQIWFDNGVNKLKFYDANGNWRTVNGAESSTTQPIGPVIGDLWWNSAVNQLYTYNGTSYTLIGGSVSSTQTQTVSKTVVDLDTGASHDIIEGLVDGKVIFTISEDPVFTLNKTLLDQNDSLGTRFTKIHPGINLAFTQDDALPGVTSSSHRFWGTATNSDRLGNLTADSYVTATGANFIGSVHFNDPGWSMGVGNKLIVETTTGSPIITNTQLNLPTIFKTTDSGGTTRIPLQLLNSDVLPGTNNGANLGNSSTQWNYIYANYVYSTSRQADKLGVGLNGVNGYAAGSIDNVTGSVSIVARDPSGNINVTSMTGTASQADTLKYSTGVYVGANTNAVQSTVVVRDASANISAQSVLLTSITKTGTNHVGDIGQVNNGFNNVYANNFVGNLTGSINGSVSGGTLTGNVVSAHTTSNITIGTVLVDVTGNKMTAETVLLGNGTATNPSLSFINDSNQSSGFYWSLNGAINISNNGVQSGSFNALGGLTLRGDITAPNFIGTASQAKYADLAEKYLPDSQYDVGTVVSIGGEKEITASSDGERALGVISEKPAYMMNSDLEGGVYVALKGRVPVKVLGRVNKGDRIIAVNGGVGTAVENSHSDTFAIALETNTDTLVKLVECVIL